ncbi:MAG: SDR family oxidoreductase [Myxococcota bacterium]
MVGEVPSMEGKTCLVTGANTGIGRVTAVELARAGAHVMLACRVRERAEPVLDEMRALAGREAATFVPLDLGDLDSVRACAEDVLDRGRPLDVLVNNAGVAGHRGQTKDGFELAFGVNHVGHFLLTMRLAERLKETPRSRVVNVASRSHYDAKGIDWEAVRRPTATVTGLREYAVSKLANVLFARELARRLEGTDTTSYSLHPGVVATDVWRRVPGPVAWLMKRFMLSPDRGAETTLHCATSPDAPRDNGRYFTRSRPKKPSRPAMDDDLATELWRRSVAWAGADLP